MPSSTTTSQLNVEFAVMSTSNPKHISVGGGADPVRAAVGHLLFKASSLPCHTAAHAFSQLVQPSSRFQLALDALLPDLTAHEEQSRRILASFLLYSIYAPHPITINPFKSVLFNTFVKEREQAIRSGASPAPALNPNEQLVWVLWKILKGAGNDIGPYSPESLARSPLPPKLRPSNLTLDEETFKSDVDDYHDQTDVPPAKRDTSPSLPITAGPLSTFSGPPHQSVDQQYAVPLQSRLVQQSSSAQEDARKQESVSQAIQLILAARERVLTLSEQRFLLPLIPSLTSPPVITSLDLSPLISLNPTLAHPLLVSLFTTSSPPPTGPSSPTFLFPPDFQHPRISSYLDVLRFLPPTLATFDLLGRLLRDTTRIPTSGSTIADLIRIHVLGRFIHESINWLDRAEREEREGLISDDRFAKGVQNLCRFYASLIKLAIVDTASDAESAEMAHFSLRNARFEEANALYRTLVFGKY